MMDGNTILGLQKYILEKPSITFLTKNSRSVELEKRMAKGISLLTKYVIVSVFLREREMGFLLQFVSEMRNIRVVFFILVSPNFYKRRSRSGLSENMFCSAKENTDDIYYSSVFIGIFMLSVS